jgi:hypothetical protein
MIVITVVIIMMMFFPALMLPIRRRDHGKRIKERLVRR